MNAGDCPEMALLSGGESSCPNVQGFGAGWLGTSRLPSYPFRV